MIYILRPSAGLHSHPNSAFRLCGHCIASSINPATSTSRQWHILSPFVSYPAQFVELRLNIGVDDHIARLVERCNPSNPASPSDDCPRPSSTQRLSIIPSTNDLSIIPHSTFHHGRAIVAIRLVEC